jgi:hypothetical protein
VRVLKGYKPFTLYGGTNNVRGGEVRELGKLVLDYRSQVTCKTKSKAMNGQCSRQRVNAKAFRSNMTHRILTTKCTRYGNVDGDQAVRCSEISER